MLPSKLYGMITNYFNTTPPKETISPQQNETTLPNTCLSEAVKTPIEENQETDTKQKSDKTVNNSTFLQTSGCSFYLENIIREAKADLYLVSPYLKINDRLFDLLKSFNNTIHIHILYGKDKRQEGIKKLKELDNCTMYYLENLHAKCYLNEVSALITSMNLYEFSQINNVEFGMIVNKESSQDDFNQIQSEVNRLLKSAEVITIKDKPKPERKVNIVKPNNEVKPVRNNSYQREPYTPKVKLKKKFTGYCIRCKEEIDYNPDSPYCYECWNSWSYFGNPDFQEKHCHRCGNKELTNMSKPQCYNCFEIWRAEKSW